MPSDPALEIESTAARITIHALCAALAPYHQPLRFRDRVMMLPSLKVLSIEDAVALLASLAKPVACAGTVLLGLLSIGFWSLTEPDDLKRWKVSRTSLRLTSDDEGAQGPESLISVRGVLPEDRELRVTFAAVQRWWHDYQVIGASFAIEETAVSDQPSGPLRELRLSRWSEADFAQAIIRTEA